MSGKVARRYAKALFALARDARVLDTVAAELADLRTAFGDPAVVHVLGSPMMTAARLMGLTQQITAQLRLSELTGKFIGVLAENRRLDQLPGVCDRFQELHDGALNRIRVAVHSAAVLPPARLSEIVATFERLTGKTVLAHVETDPALLGGVLVEVAGKVYDGSVRTQLDHLAREITGARTYL
jgi:F-type H+-transporting ATPase subunit delta